MKVLGYIVVIKRSGCDGTPYPMVNTSCSLGRNMECDIRVQLPVVSQRHCQVEVDPSGKAYVTNLSRARATIVNDHPMAAQEVRFLAHKDIITIGERQFRWEYPEGSVFSLTKSPEHLPAVGYRILTPTTKSPISRHNVEESRGQKRSYAEAECLETSDAKKKRVSFGPQLNPEHFDRLLPPSAPVSKGEKPGVRPMSGLSDSLPLNSSVRKSKRISVAPSTPVITEESCPDTPTKSLLRRRSPTPVKPYLARSLGLHLPRALETSGDHTSPKSASIGTEGKVVNGSPHQSPGSPKKQALTLSSSKTTVIESPLQSPVSSKKIKIEVENSFEVARLRKDPVGAPKSSSEVIDENETPRKNSGASRKSSPRSTPNKTPKFSLTTKTSPQSKAASPKYSHKSPKGTPKKMSVPKPSPTNMRSPNHSPKSLKSPKASQKDLESPIRSGGLKSPSASPKSMKSPSTSPKSMKSPNVSPKSMKSPKVTPKKIRSHDISASPILSPKMRGRPKSPKNMQTPKKNSVSRSTPKKITSSDKYPKKIATPKSFSRSPNVTPKSNQKKTPKASPKNTPQANPKKTLKSSLKKPPPDIPMKTPKASPKNTHQAITKQTPKASLKKSPLASPKKTTKTSLNKTPKASPMETPPASSVKVPKASPKKTPLPRPKKTPLPSPKKTPLPSPKKTPCLAPRRHPCLAPRRHPCLAPRRHPCQAPRRHPCQAPRRHPCQAPRRHPCQAPRRHPCQAPRRHPCLATRRHPV